MAKTEEIERKWNQERESYNQRLRTVTNSLSEYKASENSGVQSSKSLKKNQKY